VGRLLRLFVPEVKAVPATAVGVAVGAERTSEAGGGGRGVPVAVRAWVAKEGLRRRGTEAAGAGAGKAGAAEGERASDCRNCRTKPPEPAEVPVEEAEAWGEVRDRGGASEGGSTRWRTGC